MNTDSLHFLYKVNSDDLKAIRDNGGCLSILDPETILRHQEKTHLGYIGNNHFRISIFVTATPSCFYTLIIKNIDESITHVLKTASGNLRDFIPTALLFAEGMLHCDSVRVKFD